MKFDELFLWYLGDPAQPRYVGVLHRVDDGKGVSLRYDAAWLTSGFALSEDLPLVDIEHRPPGRLQANAPRAAGAVDDARPDRWGERVIDHLDRPSRRSLMEYLFYAGDDRFGALGTSTSAEIYSPRPGSPLPRLEDAQSLSEVVHKIQGKEAITEIERRVIRSGGSFGGAKPKALIEIDGVQWVLKFFNGEPVDLPLVEHAAMTLARKAGIRTAETLPVALVGEHALAVRRFDRIGGQRQHCISAGTALRAAVPAEQLVLGYPSLALLLRRAGSPRADQHVRDTAELFRRMVFNILIDNTDDHEKNHALIAGEDGYYLLAPAYDVVPTNSGQGSQEFVCGLRDRESSLRNAMSQHALFGLTEDQALNAMVDVVAVVNGWKEHFLGCGVTSTDVEHLAEFIDDSEVGQERLAFKREAYAATPAVGRRRKPGPFAPTR